MNIGLIGLGRMGCAIAKRLINSKFQVYGFDKDQDACQRIQNIGGKFTTIEEIVMHCDKIWLMLPAGKIIDSVLSELINATNDQHKYIIIDGGNSYFKDSVRRANELEKKNISYLDCGTSGGLHGEEIGFSLMIGGNKKAYQECEEVLKAIAAPNGYGYMGQSGSGHYVKMVHNGIEYALLQSYAEGFQLLKEGSYKNLNLEEVSKVWINGSVIRSWILQLSQSIFEKDQDFKSISGKIGGGQTGTWAAENAKENGISVPMINEALEIREWSQKTGGNYATKLVALLRNEFGGHKLG